MVATVTRIKTAATTVRYFEKDGYYAKDSPEHREASCWHGAGAAALGLKGSVDPKRFAKVMTGHVPGTDIRMGHMRAGEWKHRPGVDVTLSPPKSVSLEALVYARPRTGARVRRAHDEAVRATLDYIERDLLLTRKSYLDPSTGTYKQARIRGQGLVAATFRHLTNRNLEPQMHTHAVLANMTRNAEGEWRAVEFRDVEHNEKRIGAFYRNELQRRLHELGYATVETRIGGIPGFEIAGYSDQTRMAFSTRRAEIMEYLKKHNLENTRETRQLATLRTRKRKVDVDIGEVSAKWRKLAEETGPWRRMDVARGRTRRRERNTARRHRLSYGSDPQHPVTAHGAVRHAVEHVGERRTVMRASDLYTHALGYAQGQVSHDALTGAIGALARDGHLIEAETAKGEVAWVTDSALKVEKEILSRMRRWRGKGAPLATGEDIGRHLHGVPLDEEQRKALETILLSSNRLVGVQGYAGTGKTTMLREVAELVGRDRVTGVAPSSRAAHLLGSGIGVPGRTLQWLLVRYRDIAAGTASPELMENARRMLGGHLLIVDEAGMVGAAQMQSLMRIAEEAGVARLALVGDRWQLRSIEAGDPFCLLQDKGMETVVMKNVQRQRKSALKASVLHMIAERPDLAVEELGDDVLEMEHDELPDGAADLWLDLDEEQRGDTEILAPTHALRAEINARVREGLAEEGVLHGRTLTIDRYVNLHMTRAQKGDIRNWHEDDVAVFHNDVRPLRVVAGDTCRIAGTREEKVLLDHPDGKVRHVDPSRYVRYQVELYRTEPIELRSGDRIRWTRSNRDHGLGNGDRARVEKINPKRIRFRSEDDGRSYSLALDDPQLHHIDHAWTRTVHDAQGMTCGSVIAVLDADHGPLVDRTLFYVQLSRARDNVVVLTSDKETLVEALENRTEEELSALIATGRYDKRPAPEVTMRAKPVCWPELAAWRAFEEQAQADGLDPFEAEGSDEKLAPLLALARNPPEGLPSAVVDIAARCHDIRQRAIRTALAALEDCVDQVFGLLAEASSSGAAWTELDGYRPWRETLESALEMVAPIAADEVRYGEHFELSQRSSIDDLSYLHRADLDMGEHLDTILRGWRGLAGEHGDALFDDPSLFHHREYAPVVDGIRKLKNETPVMPAELCRVLEYDAEQGRIRETVKAGLELTGNWVRERWALQKEAGESDRPLCESARYRSWAEMSPRVETARNEVLLDQNLLHLDHLDPSGEKRRITRGVDWAIRNASDLDTLPGWLVRMIEDCVRRNMAAGAPLVMAPGRAEIMALGRTGIVERMQGLQQKLQPDHPMNAVLTGLVEIGRKTAFMVGTLDTALSLPRFENLPGDDTFILGPQCSDWLRKVREQLSALSRCRTILDENPAWKAEFEAKLEAVVELLKRDELAASATRLQASGRLARIRKQETEEAVQETQGAVKETRETPKRDPDVSKAPGEDETRENVQPRHRRGGGMSIR